MAEEMFEDLSILNNCCQNWMKGDSSTYVTECFNSEEDRRYIWVKGGMS